MREAVSPRGGRCPIRPSPILSRMIELAVVDRSRVFADAVAARLAVEPDLRVRWSATSAAALRRASAPSPVDVVVCDAALFEAETPDLRVTGAGLRPDVAGPATRTSGSAATVVVLVADLTDSDLLCPALRSGVRGWVPREASADDLVTAVREAHRGGTWVPPRLLTSVIDELSGAPPPEDHVRDLLARLTPRERDVLSCLADGLSRVEVAARLHLSTNTVRTHVQSILSKLGVNSAVAAVALSGRSVRGGPGRGHRTTTRTVAPQR